MIGVASTLYVSLLSLILASLNEISSATCIGMYHHGAESVHLNNASVHKAYASHLPTETMCESAFQGPVLITVLHKRLTRHKPP